MRVILYNTLFKFSIFIPFMLLLLTKHTVVFAQVDSLFGAEPTLKDKTIYDLSKDNTSNRTQPKSSFEMKDEPITDTKNNLGKNITDDILSLELESLDVVYSLTEKKIFTLTIKNISNENYTLKLADNFVHNIFFDVYDEIHFPVEVPTSLMVERNSDYNKFRSLEMVPGDNLTLSVDIDKYVTIKDTGVYKISARFYPKQFIDISSRGYTKSQFQPYVESNVLLVSVMDSENLDKEFNISNDNFSDIYNKKKLITREYGPYDVIEAALEALKNMDWDSFFSFVDIKELYSNTYTSSKDFKYMSLQEKQMKLSQFIKNIKNGSEINDINFPSKYTIANTQFSRFEGEVQVTTEVPSKNSTLQYSYTFFLKNAQSGWKIVNYRVRYLGIISYDTKAEYIGTAQDFRSPFE